MSLWKWLLTRAICVFPPGVWVPVFLSTTAPSAELAVGPGKPYPSIEQALGSARPGDIILVYPKWTTNLIGGGFGHKQARNLQQSCQWPWHTHSFEWSGRRLWRPRLSSAFHHSI